MLQGAVSPAPLKPFLGRDLNFWIDGVASILGHLARFAGGKHLSRSASPWQEGGARILLRHDTDWSADPTYLELEDRRKIPATYAILPDRHFDTWMDRLRRRPSLETALHYSLHVNERVRPGVFDSLRRRVQGVRSLEAQCKDFERRGGRVFTVHRHLGTFAYPQDVEQLFRAERAIPTLTGSCTMFRFKETRVFGADADRGSIEHPDTNISLWFPYKLVRATVDGLEFLSGWESGAFVEPSAAVVTGLLRHARRFPGGVYPVVFHPAHARSSVLAKGGMQTVFARLVDSARRRGIGFDTFERTYANLNEWDPNP